MVTSEFEFGYVIWVGAVSGFHSPKWVAYRSRQFWQGHTDVQSFKRKQRANF